MEQKSMGETLGSLKISQGQVTGGRILEVDQGLGLEDGREVGVEGAAAADREVCQKVGPDPGLGAKVDLVLDQKAGNPDQRASQSPSLIEEDPAHDPEAGLRGMRSLGAGLAPALVPPKKMEKVTSSQSLGQGASLGLIHPRLLHPQRLALCPLRKRELQGLVLGLLVQKQGHGPDQVPEINSELCSFLCTLLWTLSYLLRHLILPCLYVAFFGVNSWKLRHAEICSQIRWKDEVQKKWWHEVKRSSPFFVELR